MTPVLRGYQQQLKAAIYDAWNRGAQIVFGVTATGSGKTTVMGNMAHELEGYGVIQAHRAELVGQISLALAREGVRHNIVAAKKTIKAIVASHMEELGANFYDPRARWEVQSVDTIIRREQPLANRVNWVFTDEGHHVLRENKWGRGIASYPNAKVLLMTATPCRADGKGLGSHSDGIADAMAIGPGLAELMADGYLVTYRAFTPSVSDLNLADVHITASGEFNQQEVARAVKRSNLIVGSVVDTYIEHARGKLGITFAVDIEHAETLAQAFNAAGVPAAMVSSETDEADRRAIMKRYKARELWQLVNVDLFGEGVDVPGVEVVSMARPTASFSLYAQQVGRMLRLLIDSGLMQLWDTFTVAERLAHIAASAKPFAMLFDHVGNTRREFNVGGIKYTGLPEGFASWSLDARARKSRVSDDGIPLRKCLACFKDYERILDGCPYCGTAAPAPTDRSKPELVDGNLYELDPLELARMRAEVARIADRPYMPAGLPPHAQAALIKRHHERQVQQHHLREAIAYWAGMHAQDTDSVNYRRFYHTFGTDVMSALTLGASDAEQLTKRIQAKWTLPPLPVLQAPY